MGHNLTIKMEMLD